MFISFICRRKQMKRILFLAVMLTLLAFVYASATDVRIVTSKGDAAKFATGARAKNVPLVRGDEKVENLQYFPAQPGLMASPGDIMGWTQYDYQSNGSSGNRIARDSNGGLHMSWMNGIDYGGGLRIVSYNYVDPAGAIQWPGTGTDVTPSYRNGDGYTQITVTADSLAIVGNHNATYSGGTLDTIFMGVDAGTGWGIFTSRARRMIFGGNARGNIWPYITMDNGGRLHVLATETTVGIGETQTLGYMRSPDRGITWTTPDVIDTVMVIAGVIVSSPVSNKVAIVWNHPTDTAYQWFNDVYYVLSNDGVTWDFRNGKVNVTDYAPTPETLFAYTDIDAVFDYNDNLHLLWHAQPTWPDTGGTVWVSYDSRLYHFNRTVGVINEVTRFDSSWWDTDVWCDMGAWNFGLAKMSLGVDITNNALFTTYTSWTWNDCALSGFANGDIFMQYSTNGGTNWTLRGNMTNSHTDSCAAGFCESDHWSSLAEHVDDNMHLFYVNDKDAGGIPQTEGSITDNPMLYYRFPNPVRGMAIPSAPALIFPENGGSYDSAAYFVFEWNEPLHVARFRIELDDEATFATPLAVDSMVMDNQWINPDSLVLGTYYWRVKAIGYYGSSSFSPTWSFTNEPPSGCNYIRGNINGVPPANGIDVTFGVAYLKGGSVPPNTCPMCPQPHPFYAAMDVNGSCTTNGIDITYFVGFLKGGPPLLNCPSCPPTP
jgi:hypothetical protein